MILGLHSGVAEVVWSAGMKFQANVLPCKRLKSVILIHGISFYNTCSSKIPVMVKTNI